MTVASSLSRCPEASSCGDQIRTVAHVCLLPPDAGVLALRHKQSGLEGACKRACRRALGEGTAQKAYMSVRHPTFSSQVVNVDIEYSSSPPAYALHSYVGPHHQYKLAAMILQNSGEVVR